ncbi:MAG: efflux RND transporter periplasmic adaptor subunit [Gemmataceae bacterium]
MNAPRPIVWIVGLTVLSGCVEKHPPVVETPTTVVEVATPVDRTVADYRVFTARTQAVQSVDVKARVTGYLTKILYKDGDDVKAGAVLFQIDDRPYKAALDQAKASLDAAKASVEVAKAAVIKTQADYDIGLSVRKQSAGAISEQELTRRLGARDEAKGTLDQAKAAINQAEAAIETAQLNYDWCKVTAPLTGRVNAHAVDVGGLVSQNVTTLTNVVSLKPMWAYFDVDENTVLGVRKLIEQGKLKDTEKAAVAVQMGLANDKAFPFAGTIDFVSNQLDANTGSIRARAVFPNDDTTLVAGLFGRLRVPIAPPHKALLVTDRAVGTNQGQKFILVVNDKQEVEARAVDVGQVYDGLREVCAPGR